MNTTSMYQPIKQIMLRTNNILTPDLSGNPQHAEALLQFQGVPIDATFEPIRDQIDSIKMQQQKT